MKKTTEEYFDSLIAEIMKVGIEKMTKYGSSWTAYRPSSLLTRMLNKGKRVVAIQKDKQNLVGEKISGEFREIMSYATLLAMQSGQKIAQFKSLSVTEVATYRENVFSTAREIMIKKNHDYGEAWRSMAQEEIIDEINVKIMRMKYVVKQENILHMDSVYDVINYCAFALILLQEGIHQDL